MKLALYVHDFHIEIGHTRAMIDLLNGLSLEKKNNISSITILAFTASDPELLMPDFKGKIRLTTLPFKNLKPFLLKMLFYHVISFFHSLLLFDSIKIGIGIANLNVDISNIQFIHQQWNPIFFKNRKLSPLAFLYKKILFTYFSLCETLFFNSKKRQYIVIANFMRNFLKNEKKISEKNLTLLPSSVDLEKFQLIDLTEKDFSDLLCRYPVISNINKNDPIFLFVGAFERKGLDKVLRFFKQIKTPASLIVIGKSEDGKIMKDLIFPNIYHIPFTKEVHMFYNLADVFLFPTYYEPFGLVILEAYSMGIDIVIPKENVGASEVIDSGEGVHFISQTDEIHLPNFSKISFEQRENRRKKRLNTILKNDWTQNANKFYSMLERI